MNHLAEIQPVLELFASDFPPAIWFVPIIVLVGLLIASVIDAYTGHVPVRLLWVTLLISMGAFALYTDWIEMLQRFGPALIPTFLLLGINAIVLKYFEHDAFGLGDVQWTLVAAFTFGPWPAIWSWLFGAILASIWIGLRKLWYIVMPTYEGHEYVHFVPFLMIGLIATLLLQVQPPQGWHI